MAHDRMTLSGTMISGGIIYMQLKYKMEGLKFRISFLIIPKKNSSYGRIIAVILKNSAMNPATVMAKPKTNTKAILQQSLIPSGTCCCMPH
jgi:hypothetical protein